MNILLVDDEPLVRSSMARLISGLSDRYHLFEAEDGEEAVQTLGAERVDLVITDIRMPAMGGLELAGYIRKEYSDLHVIMLTGYEDFEYARTAMGYGVKDYLLKPVSVDALKETIFKTEAALIARRQKDEIASLRNRDLFEKKVQDLLYEMPLPYYDESLFPAFEQIGVLCIVSDEAGFRTKHIRFSIKNIIGELLSDYGTAVTVIEETHLTCILFAKSSRSEQWEAIMKLITETIQKLLKISLIIKQGGTSGRLSGVSGLYQNGLRQIGVLEPKPEKAEPGEATHRIIRSAIEVIGKDYNHELTLTALSEKLFVHPNYLSGLFKAETGYTFSQYLTRVRMDHAKQLLRETNLKIYQICSEVGYSDQAHFSRVFKSLEGMNPYEYREKHSI